MTHPVEDWATCVEAYFYGEPEVPGANDLDPNHDWMQANLPAKFAFVEDFLQSFHG